MKSADHVLLADIGGTHARFALADPAAAIPLINDSVRPYRVADYASPVDAARHYLNALDVAPARAVMAVAGPVIDGKVKFTNSPWRIDAAETTQALGLRKLDLVNDFNAMGMAPLLLTPADIATIGPIEAKRVDRAHDATFAISGPGTGLGVGALLIRDGRAFALQTEGGHAGFAPTTPDEIEILRHLARRFGRVSIERLISGQGLVNLYTSVCEIAGSGAEALTPEQISARAIAGIDSDCSAAVDHFCAIFGCFIGDLVLTFGAWDGVYLAGGLIAPLCASLQRGEFRRRFEEKGRYASVMARVPTLAILHENPGLLGAAAIATTSSSTLP